MPGSRVVARPVRPVVSLPQVPFETRDGADETHEWVEGATTDRTRRWQARCKPKRVTYTLVLPDSCSKSGVDYKRKRESYYHDTV